MAPTTPNLRSAKRHITDSQARCAEDCAHRPIHENGCNNNANPCRSRGREKKRIEEQTRLTVTLQHPKVTPSLFYTSRLHAFTLRLANGDAGPALEGPRHLATGASPWTSDKTKKAP